MIGVFIGNPHHRAFTLPVAAGHFVIVPVRRRPEELMARDWYELGEAPERRGTLRDLSSENDPDSPVTAVVYHWVRREFDTRTGLEADAEQCAETLRRVLKDIGQGAYVHV